jgi:hypothetical protein
MIMTIGIYLLTLTHQPAKQKVLSNSPLQKP